MRKFNHSFSFLGIDFLRTLHVGMAMSRQSTQGRFDSRKQSGSRQRPGNDNPDIKLSKRLSYILRHGASKEGFELLPGGFLFVEDLLKHKDFKYFKESDIERVVESNEKKRFHLEKDETGKCKIRANQGHTIKVDTLDLQPLTDPQEYSDIVHGTYKRLWKSIKDKGLSKMKRTHIHLAPGLPGENDVISGMRGNCDLVIYIDIEKALADGLKFYVSTNNVILTEGNEDGILEAKYFKKVVDPSSNKTIDMDNKTTDLDKNAETDDASK